GRGNNKTNGLPGEQHQQCIKRQRHQWHARPKPSVGQCSSQKRDKLSWTEFLPFTHSFHPVGDRNLAAGGAQDQYDEQQHDADHAATSSRCATTSVVRGFVWLTSSTPMQISKT